MSSGELLKGLGSSDVDERLAACNQLSNMLSMGDSDFHVSPFVGPLKDDEDEEEIEEQVENEEKDHNHHYISWVNLPEDTYYIPNAIWHKNKDDLYITTLNRKQNDLKFFRYNLIENESTLVLNDKNETWVDAYDFFGSPGLFNIDVLNNDEIIWISERDGFKHIYRSRPDGQFINQITRGKW